MDRMHLEDDLRKAWGGGGEVRLWREEANKEQAREQVSPANPGGIGLIHLGDEGLWCLAMSLC